MIGCEQEDDSMKTFDYHFPNIKEDGRTLILKVIKRTGECPVFLFGHIHDSEEDRKCMEEMNERLRSFRRDFNLKQARSRESASKVRLM